MTSKRSPWGLKKPGVGAVACGSAALLAACVAVPPLPAVTQVALPLNWAGAVEAAGQVPVQVQSLAWWERFDDPLLSELIRDALAANTRVNEAQAVLLQAQAQRVVIAAALWPRLDGSASAQSGTAGGDSVGQRFQLGLEGNWRPDLFGATRSAVEAGDATTLSSAASLGDVRVQVAAELALNYMLLRTLQARLRIARDNLGSQEEILQITGWREQAGLVTALETAQARAAAAQTRALLPVLQTSFAQTSHALAVLAGRPPAALLLSLADPRALPQMQGEPVLRIPAETLRQRADVRAAEFQVTAALAQVGQAEAERWPGFSIGGSLGLSAASVGALTRGASVLSSLLAGISLPVFDAGAGRAGVRVQQAALVQAQQRYRAAVLTALREVEDALVSLQGDRERLVSLRIAADAAALAATLARQRYSSGLVDFQTVLETLRTQLGTQDVLASAGADVAADQVRLFRALGGGWREQDLALSESSASAAVPQP